MIQDFQASGDTPQEQKLSLISKAPGEVAAIIWRILHRDPGAEIRIVHNELLAVTRERSLEVPPITSYQELSSRAQTLIVSEEFEDAVKALLHAQTLAARQRMCVVAVLAQTPEVWFPQALETGQACGVQVYRDATLDIGDAFLALLAPERLCDARDAVKLLRLSLRPPE